MSPRRSRLPAFPGGVAHRNRPRRNVELALQIHGDLDVGETTIRSAECIGEIPSRQPRTGALLRLLVLYTCHPSVRHSSRHSRWQILADLVDVAPRRLRDEVFASHRATVERNTGRSKLDTRNPSPLPTFLTFLVHPAREPCGYPWLLPFPSASSLQQPPRQIRSSV
jgi:hypothetical protein